MCENYRKKFDCKSTVNNGKIPNKMTDEQKKEVQRERMKERKKRIKCEAKKCAEILSCCCWIDGKEVKTKSTFT